MESQNNQRIKIANEQESQFKANNNQTRILIAGGYPTIRQRLLKFINQKPDIAECIEAKSTNQPVDAVSKQQVDLAIIDISSKDTNGFKLADKVKLQCPNLPIILLSMNDGTSHAERTLQAEAKKSFSNQQITEQIIKAIHYARSLLASQIFGFTLVVNFERSPQDGY